MLDGFSQRGRYTPQPGFKAELRSAIQKLENNKPGSDPKFLAITNRALVILVIVLNPEEPTTIDIGETTVIKNPNPDEKRSIVKTMGDAGLSRDTIQEVLTAYAKIVEAPPPMGSLIDTHI